MGGICPMPMDGPIEFDTMPEDHIVSVILGWLTGGPG
jgi:hypothetical protein